MNFITLGIDRPDYQHPVVKKRKKQLEETEVLSEDDQLIKVVRALQSSAYASEVEKLRLYYQQKLSRLQLIFNLKLGKFALFNKPQVGLSAWAELSHELFISAIVPELKALGLFQEEENKDFNPELPITGIHIGFGDTALEVYEQAFELIARCCRSLYNVIEV